MDFYLFYNRGYLDIFFKYLIIFSIVYNFSFSYAPNYYREEFHENCLKILVRVNSFKPKMWLFLYMFKNVNAKKGIHDRHEKQGRSYMLKGGGVMVPPKF